MHASFSLEMSKNDWKTLEQTLNGDLQHVVNHNDVIFKLYSDVIYQADVGLNIVLKQSGQGYSMYN